MRFVPVKSAEQLAVQAVHRIRSRLVAVARNPKWRMRRKRSGKTAADELVGLQP
jgi:hypothetical protein